jgi:rhomboid protease GluP
MDWSLALTSQDIESIVRSPTEEHAWCLAVAEADYDQAVRILEEYRQENRDRPWHQAVPRTGMVFHRGVVGWALLMLGLFAADQYFGLVARNLGILDVRATLTGQWCRLVTATTLHADAGHLCANVGVGLFLGGIAMARWGAGWACLAGLSCGISGNLLTCLVFSHAHRSLGASGVIMGFLGLVVAPPAAGERPGIGPKPWLVTSVLTGFFLFMLLGVDPQANVVAHLGGWITGWLLGVLWGILPERVRQNPLGDRLAGLIFFFILAYAWYRALSVSPL